MTDYCRICGHSNIYTLKKPNFCGGCGKTLAGLVTIPKKVTVPHIQIESESEQEESIEGIDLDNLKSKDFGLEYIPTEKNVITGIDGLLAMGDPGTDSAAGGRAIPVIKNKKQLKERQQQFVQRIREKKVIEQE